MGKRQSQYRNLTKSRRYRLLYNRYKMLGLNMFRWEGLPETIKPRHIEQALFDYGKAVFFEHEDFGLICLPCDYTTDLNAYGEGKQYIAHGYGFTKQLKDGPKVQIMLNNDLGISTREYVEMYANKMVNVEMSIDQNIMQQRIPWVVEGTKDTKFSLEQVFKQIIDGEMVVHVNKELGLSSNSNVIQLTTPFIALQLNEYKYELEREILTFFSLNNTVEKQERLLVDEINSNNDFIEQNAEIMFRTRKDFAKEVNKKFGTNIQVFKTSIHNKKEDDGENGRVYNGTPSNGTQQ